MITFRRALWVALLALGLQPARSADNLSIDLFASDPRGPSATGTFEEMWIDEQRDEPTTNDPRDKRHLMVQFWYPATVEPNSPKAPYVLHPELYSDQVGKWFPFAKTVRTTSVLNATLLASDQAFPVVIYNPGGGNPHFTGTSQAEYLASHGYVVMAIGHTGLNRIERFPDGYSYQLDVGDPEPTKAERETMTDADAFRLEVERTAKSMMPLHVQDIRFVLDRLQAMNSKAGNRFQGRLDRLVVGRSAVVTGESRRASDQSGHQSGRLALHRCL